VHELQQALLALRRQWNKSTQETGNPGWSPDVVEVRAQSIDQLRIFAQDVSEMLVAFEQAYARPAASSMADCARLVAVIRRKHYPIKPIGVSS
jgi:hypothetical protein